MRLVSFNIEHGLSADGEVDLDLLAETCAGFDADVLALQEVDVGVRRSGRVDQAAAIAAASGMDMVFGGAARLAPGDYGNALLVRGVVLNWSIVQLPRTGRNEPRSLLHASVDVGEHSFGIVVTHLSTRRPEVFDQLQAVAAFASGNEAELVMGDFNLTRREVEPVLRAAGLVVLDGPSTFPAASPNAAIDHIAVRPPWRIRSVSAPLTPCSDHRPLVAEVELDG